MVIPTTANSARSRRRFVKNRELFILLKASGCTACVSRECSAFSTAALEERADWRLDFFCAFSVFLAGTFLFGFFDGDTFDLYSGSIHITGVARRDGHEHIQTFYHLTKDA